MKVSSSVAHTVAVGGWREQLRERRRLAQQDRVSAQLAELTGIREVVAAAREVVAAGWAQDVWFVCRGEHGGRHAVDLPAARRATSLPVAEACLVGAILHAGGGVARADTQLVQRTLDLTWHALHRTEDEPVRWCPAPGDRAQHLRDLVRWNDEPGRTSAEVQALLRSAGRVADAETGRTRRQCDSRDTASPLDPTRKSRSAPVFAWPTVWT